MTDPNGPSRPAGELARLRDRAAAGVFFNHVPKCAGTTLGEMLAMTCREDQLFTTKRIDAAAIGYAPRSVLRDARVIWGHFRHADADRCGPRLRIINLREPFGRFRSLMRHLWRSREGVAPAVKAYLESMDPAMLRQPACAHELRGYAMFGFLLDRGSMPAMMGGPLTPALRDEALANLETYDIIVLDDRMDHASRTIAAIVGLPQPERAARLNTADRWRDSLEIDPPEAHFDSLGRLSEFDRAIHARAVELADAQARRLGPDLDAAPAAWRERMRAASTRREFMLDWAEPAHAHGWSERREIALPAFEGRAVRAVAAPRAFIDIPLRSCRSAELELVAWASDVGLQRRFRLLADGGAGPQPVALAPLRGIEPLTVWRGTTGPVADAGVRLIFEYIGDPPTAPDDLWVADLWLRAAPDA